MKAFTVGVIIFALLIIMIILIIGFTAGWDVFSPGNSGNSGNSGNASKSRTTTLTQDGAVTERFLTTIKIPTYQSIKQYVTDPSANPAYRFQGVIKKDSLSQLKQWLTDYKNSSNLDHGNWKSFYDFYNLRDRATYDAFIATVQSRIDDLSDGEIQDLALYLKDELNFEFNPDTGVLMSPEGKPYAPITGKNLRPDNEKKYIQLDVYMVIMMVMHRLYGWNYVVLTSPDWAPFSLDEYTHKKDSAGFSMSETRSDKIRDLNANKTSGTNRPPVVAST